MKGKCGDTMNSRLKFIYGYVKSYKFIFLRLFFVIIATTMLGVSFPYIFGAIVDALFYGENVTLFFQLGGLYFIVFFINQIFHYNLEMTLTHLYNEFLFDIKKNIFSKVLTYKSKELDKISTGDILYRINFDTDEVLAFFKSDIFYGLSAVLEFLLCLLVSAYISWILAGVVFILTLISFVVSNALSKKLQPLYKKNSELTGQNQSWLFEILNGMRDLRLLNAIGHCASLYFEREKDIIDNNERIVDREIIADRINAGIQLIASIIIFVVGAFHIGADLLTLGGLIAVIDYYNRMIAIANRIYKKILSLSKRVVAIDRIMDTVGKESEENEGTFTNTQKLKGQIEFKDVSFSYEEKKEVLSNVNLTIKAGEKFAIVGKSGAGKSTITELICRLYDVDKGKILLDGLEINNYELEEYRKVIGLVQQSGTIFTGTLRYNLIFSNDKHMDAEIWKLLKMVDMHDFVKRLPMELDTVLSSSVPIMSGGQQQRLTLLRVYLRKPQILVLDESTSALDNDTEENVLRASEELFRDNTIIVIAHRLSTIIDSDKIAYLEDGKIVACDKHDVLYRTCLEYKLFYDEYFSLVDERKND